MAQTRDESSLAKTRDETTVENYVDCHALFVLACTKNIVGIKRSKIYYHIYENIYRQTLQYVFMAMDIHQEARSIFWFSSWKEKGQEHEQEEVMVQNEVGEQNER